MSAANTLARLLEEEKTEEIILSSLFVKLDEELDSEYPGCLKQDGNTADKEYISSDAAHAFCL